MARCTLEMRCGRVTEMLRGRSCARAALRAKVHTPLRGATLFTISIGSMALAGLKPCSWFRPALRHSLVGVAKLSQKTLRAFHRAPTRAHPFALLAAWDSLPTLLALAETHQPKETAGGAADARLGRRGDALKGPARGQKGAADSARR